MPNPIDISGQRFGRLVALRPVTERFSSGKANRVWICRCDCGGEARTNGTRLRNGHTSSCGCLQREVAADRLTTHGRTRSNAYRSWRAIKRRCRDKKDHAYPAYGGAGIDIADEWANDFASFFSEVGEAPSDEHTIDRIDNSRGYVPGNIRWADRDQQSRNTSRNVWLQVGGKRLCLSDAAKRSGLKPATVWSRIKRGWSVQAALETPVVRRDQ